MLLPALYMHWSSAPDWLDALTVLMMFYASLSGLQRWCDHRDRQRVIKNGNTPWW